MAETKRDLTELNKLEEYLKDHGFDYVREDWTNMESLDDIYDHHQIIVMEDGRRVWDVVCHYGSYGAVEGLLEGMGEIFEEDVEGWLTADEVIARIEKHAQETET
jgi:hypothetical protein